MKAAALFSIIAMLGLPGWSADLSEAVKAAAEKLAQQPNYSWTVKVQPQRTGRGQGGQNRPEGQGGQGRGGRFGGFGGGFGSGMPDGQTERNGFAVLTYRFGSNTTEAVLKGSKVALKIGDEWQTGEELADAAADDGQNRSRFMVRRVQQFKAPALAAQELLGRVKDLKQEGDAYAGELTAAAIKEMFTSRGRQGRGGQGGGNLPAPDTSGLKGTAKFWVKDGLLAKYESHVEGKMTLGRQDRETDVNRKTTVEIKDVGSTKLVVPAEAKKKLTVR